MAHTELFDPKTDDQRRRLREQYLRDNRRHLVHRIRKRLVLRLFIVALLVSAIVAAIVYWRRVGELQKTVIEFGRASIQETFPDIKNVFKARSDSDSPALKGDLDVFLRQTPGHREGRFVYIALYDQEQQLLERASLPAHQYESELEQYCDLSEGRFDCGEQLWQYRLPIDDAVLVQFMGAVRENDAVIGFVEVVYEVYPAAIAGIYHGIYLSIVLAIAIVAVTAVAVYPVIMLLTNRLINTIGHLTQSHFEVLAVLSEAIAQHDTDTNEHNFRVTIMAVRCAEALRLPNESLMGIFKGALIHDVGKIGIRDRVLLKPDKLDEKEYDEMKQHVDKGCEIVKNSDWLKDGAAIVHHHHEKYDGSGYPDGLSGEDIPIAARIFAIIDVFDALTSRRPYKEPFTLPQAIKILEEGRATHFDPALLDVFQKIAPSLYQDLTDKDPIEIEKQILSIVERLFVKEQPV